MNFTACEIWFGAQVRVADNVQVGKSGKSQGLAESTSSGALEVYDEVRVIADMLMGLISQKERAQQRGLVLACSTETVWALIRRVKRRVGLKNDIGLA